MTSSRMTAILVALALAAVLTGCKERKDPGFQGWVEADMIFVSPMKAAVSSSSMREGDEVKRDLLPSTTICSRPSIRTRRRSPTRSRHSIVRRR